MIAIPFGLFMGGIRVLGAAFEAYVDALSAMPRVAFIPIIIVFLGLGFEAKIFIVFIGAVMPILINTYAGVLQLRRRAGRDGALGRRQRYADLSQDHAARRVALHHRRTAGRRLARAHQHGRGRALHRGQGLGGLLSIYGNSFRMAPYFVVVFVLGAIGVAVMQSLSFSSATWIAGAINGNSNS